MCFGIPRPIGYLISAVVIIPLVTHGITLISRFQLWTQPLWIVLHILPFAAIAYANPHSFAEWTKFAGEHGDPRGHLDLLLFGTAASVVFSLVAQIGEQVDFLRFLPRDRRTLAEGLVDRAAQRRPRLDRARRAEAAGRLVPRRTSR